MADWPILCSQREVLAMLRGNIAQTVRTPGKTWDAVFAAWRDHMLSSTPTSDPPYLWVREAGYRVDEKQVFIYEAQTSGEKLVGRRDNFGTMMYVEDFARLGWSVGDLGEMEPPLKCSRWASRFTLYLKDMREIDLQDLTEGDLVAQGYAGDDVLAEFCQSWEQHHDRDGERWDDNPTVYQIAFEVLNRNIGPKAA